VKKKKMNTKNSKWILPTTVFVAIIVLFAFAAMCTSVSAAPSEGSVSPGATTEEISVTDPPTPVKAGATVRVAVPHGAWWTNEVVNYLNTVPDKSAEAIPPNAPLSTLRNYDALVVYGNVQVDGNAVLQWVDEGGRLVITPWSLINEWVPSIGFTAAEPSLPAYNPYHLDLDICSIFRTPLNINLLLPNHPMVDGILFASDSVGYERGSIAKTDATEIARWNDDYDSTAITCWEYGDGVVVYLNMHYITSDCDRAIWYGWGKELLVNSIQRPCIIPVYVDIKPGSCPNPLNVKSKGVLPVAVLGTEDFDVTTIDPATIELTLEDVEEGVSPLRWNYEDVATPFEGELCDCHELEGDGYMDLTLKFDTQELVEELELCDDFDDGEEVHLIITGKLYDGKEIKGEDCIRVLEKGKE
jgi:hypothetical protein